MRPAPRQPRHPWPRARAPHTHPDLRNRLSLPLFYADHGHHGWHLGEKAINGKHSLRERSTRASLVFACPGVTAGQRVNNPAEPLDIFPTLIELTGIPENPGLEEIAVDPREWQNLAAKAKLEAVSQKIQHNAPPPFVR